MSGTQVWVLLFGVPTLMVVSFAIAVAVAIRVVQTECRKACEEIRSVDHS